MQILQSFIFLASSFVRMRSASLITVTSRIFILSRCCSVAWMSADQRDYSDEKATKPTKSEICDINIYYGVKESHF